MDKTASGFILQPWKIITDPNNKNIDKTRIGNDLEEPYYQKIEKEPNTT